MQKPPSYRHEPKVIINAPRSRNSEPTIVNMPIPAEQRSAMNKTRIAIGVAMGAMAIGTGVILAKDLTGGMDKKTAAPSAEAVGSETAPETPPANILVATAAPSVEDSSEDPEENLIPTATALAAPDLAKPASAMPVSPTATAKTWTAPKPQPLPKSGIIREVPF